MKGVKLFNIKIKKIGNLEPYIKELYKNLKKQQQNLQRNNRIFVDIENLLGILVDNENFKPASYFEQETDRSFGSWHYDGGLEKRGHGMVISTYPYPTQIFLPKKKNPSFYGFEKDIVARNKIITNLVKAGDGEIIIPEPGDIYQLDGPVIHRTNPKAYGKPRLVARIWY